MSPLAIASLGGSQQSANVFDRRRFVGPESSAPFAHFPATPSLIATGSDITKTRADGRSNADSRPIGIKTGSICQANGSCYIETGRTKVICAVYGPKPRPSSSSASSTSPLVISFRFAPFCMPGGRLTPTALANAEGVVSQLLHQSLVPSLLAMSETSIVEIHVTVLEWDGPLSPGPCVLASSVALASASIPTLGLVIPTTLALRPERLVDPTAAEAGSASAIFDLAYIPAMRTVTHVAFRLAADWKSGAIELDLFDRCLDQCRSNAELVHGLAVKALEDEANLRLANNSATVP